MRLNNQPPSKNFVDQTSSSPLDFLFDKGGFQSELPLTYEERAMLKKGYKPIDILYMRMMKTNYAREDGSPIFKSN